DAPGLRTILESEPYKIGAACPGTPSGSWPSGPEHCIRNPPILTPNLRLILLEPRRLRTQDGQVCVNENLGVDADWLRSMACEHDEIVDPLCAFGSGAQFSRRVACPIRAPLLIVVTSSVVDQS